MKNETFVLEEIRCIHPRAAGVAGVCDGVGSGMNRIIGESHSKMSGSTPSWAVDVRSTGSPVLLPNKEIIGPDWRPVNAEWFGLAPPRDYRAPQHISYELAQQIRWAMLGTDSGSLLETRIVELTLNYSWEFVCEEIGEPEGFIRRIAHPPIMHPNDLAIS